MTTGTGKNSARSIPSNGPSERSAAVAGYDAAVTWANLALGMALGLALAVALWWAGHPAAATAALLATGLGASACSYLPLEAAWIGADWVANRGFVKLSVLDASAIGSIELPTGDIGLGYLILRGDGRTVRIDITEMFHNPDLATAVLHVVELARGCGTAISTEADSLLASLRSRHG